MNGSRELDAKLAEALGWVPGPTEEPVCPKEEDGCGALALRPKCMWELGGYCPRHAVVDAWRAAQRPPSYYSAPTWETTGQLIEGLAKHWEVRITGGLGQLWHVNFYRKTYDGTSSLPSLPPLPPLPPNGSAINVDLPRAVAEAARLALGIEAPEETTIAAD